MYVVLLFITTDQYSVTGGCCTNLSVWRPPLGAPLAGVAVGVHPQLMSY